MPNIPVIYPSPPTERSEKEKTRLVRISRLHGFEVKGEMSNYQKRLLQSYREEQCEAIRERLGIKEKTAVVYPLYPNLLGEVLGLLKVDAKGYEEVMREIEAVSKCEKLLEEYGIVSTPEPFLPDIIEDYEIDEE